MKTTNRRFNRIELDKSHIYLTDFGTEPLQGHEHEGFIKCKLIHSPWGSVILPDQLYLGNEATAWIQPLAFTPCILHKIDEQDMRASVYVDISCGNTVRVDFNHRDLVRKGTDGSELFRCRLVGPSDLASMATGESRFNVGGVPELLLYHHTADATKPLIERSGHFRASKWNIQGNKELLNVHYVYFTCLDRITKQEDLIQIAMASDGKIHMIRDGFTPPPFLSEDRWREQYAKDILELEVYRESTANRTAVIEVFVSSEDLASQHLLFHQPPGGNNYYEVCKPFIFRIGLHPGDILPIDSSARTVKAERTKQFTHIVAGDATNIAGLRAPFDEENTEDIFKIEATPAGHSVVSFWFTFKNQDLFSGKSVEAYQFKSNNASGETA